MFIMSSTMVKVNICVFIIGLVLAIIGIVLAVKAKYVKSDDGGVLEHLKTIGIIVTVASLVVMFMSGTLLYSSFSSYKEITTWINSIMQ